MRAIVPAAIVFFIMATSLMARLFDAADDEPCRRIRKLSFGHDITAMCAGAVQAECAFIDVARLWLLSPRSFRGACEASEPGIQTHIRSLHLDSGLTRLRACPGMTR
jgi:hypothetical protein